MRYKYKLIHRNTGEIATCGNDNTVVFGGTWGASDEQGPFYIWIENIPTPEQIKQQKIATLNAEYAEKYAAKKEQIVTAQAMGKTELIPIFQNQYNILLAEHKTKKEMILNGTM